MTPETFDALAALDAGLGREGAMVRVVVAGTRGSAPREAGATLLVSATGQEGTIGGGRLEFRAVEIARAMLGRTANPSARVDRFVLGTTLGQCCGGVVELVFDRLDAADRSFVQEALVARARGGPLVLATGLGRGGATRSLHSRAADIADDAAEAERCAVRALLAAAEGAERAVLVLAGRNAEPLLLERIDDEREPLWIFGAGHVGRALVRAFTELPFRTTWVDSRDGVFPSHVPANVTVLAGAEPVACVAGAPAGSHMLVLTHSHELDFDLARAILQRDDLASFGLIGSDSKAVRFRKRLAASGVNVERLAAMRCPIGIEGIGDKRPALIAVSVAAELLRLVEARRARARAPSPRSAAGGRA